MCSGMGTTTTTKEMVIMISSHRESGSFRENPSHLSHQTSATESAIASAKVKVSWEAIVKDLFSPFLKSAQIMESFSEKCINMYV